MSLCLCWVWLEYCIKYCTSTSRSTSEDFTSTKLCRTYEVRVIPEIGLQDAHLFLMMSKIQDHPFKCVIVCGPAGLFRSDIFYGTVCFWCLIFLNNNPSLSCIHIIRRVIYHCPAQWLLTFHCGQFIQPNKLKFDIGENKICLYWVLGFILCIHHVFWTQMDILKVRLIFL